MKDRWLSTIATVGVTVAVLAWWVSPAAAQSPGWDSLWYGGPGGYGYTWIGWGWAAPYASYGYGSPYHPTGSTTSGGITSDLRTAFYSAPVDPGNGALVDVHVPAHARVFFDGAATQSPGPYRRFASPPLAPDRSYNYEIRAAWTQDGGTVERTHQVEVRRGQRANIDFLAKSGTERETKSSDEFSPPPRPPKADSPDQIKPSTAPPPRPPAKPESPDENKPPHAF